jgi:tungstate transport system substrate-binding protein
MFRKTLVLSTVLLVLAGLLAGCGATPAPATAPTAAAEPTAAPATAPTTPSEPTKLILATTTSTADSGLLDYILPDFEQLCNCQVDVIAVGTGQSLEIGAKGDADVVLVHSRKGEDQFVANGDAKERFDVMYNDYIILGPTADPAKIGGMAMAKDAFTAIAAAKAIFVSRGDKSGTNAAEMSVWASANISPTQQVDWYNSIGQGMGDTLVFANEKLAYTLADRGTYLSMRDKLPSLAILVGGNNLAENKDKALYNPYGVLAVNPDKHPGVNYDLAMQFVNWILSVPTQEMIGGYGVDKFGQPLFYPNSAEYKAAQSAGQPALKITGVPTEVSWSEDQLKAMGTIDVDYTGKDGQTTTYTGVLLTKLLEEAKAPADAEGVVLVASDAYTAEVAMADLQGCADCIVAFDPEGGLRSVLPSLSGKAQVKNLVEIQVKGGTGGAAPAASGIPENAALKITGKVTSEIGWTEDAIKAMNTLEAQSTNKQGETQTYTGVSIKELLALAGPAADAATVVFVGDDGYTAEAPLADVMACADCIVSFRNQGGFSTVLPGFAGSLQVKGVIEIQVK